MLVSFLYIILAILGLSFLIFIHELGHYFMARRVGMRVETFAIGFGKPIYSWERDGVKWQIGWLLFGGYVKIAGVDLDDTKNPYEITDGFFGKSPLDRIKVAIMGPAVNIVFAFVAFTVLWMAGGRQKHFSDFTSKIGWVDPESQLYAAGIRPGDEITAYDDHSYQGSKDHLYAPMTSSDKLLVKGFKVDYSNGNKTPFQYDVKVYPHPSAVEKGVVTSGITQPASYIFYDRLVDGSENPLPEGSPLKDSGIQYGDRIYWVDGEIIFSLQQLNHVLNGDKVLLTVERKGETKLLRIPRVPLQELKLDHGFREELIDWQFEAHLNNIKFQNLYAIPYNLTNDAVVENPVKFIDKDKQEEAFPAQSYSALEMPLEVGDKIIAISGMPVKHSADLLKKLQTYSVNIIVERDSKLHQPETWRSADADFDEEINWKDLQAIANSIGTTTPIKQKGNLFLLTPVIPKVRSEFELSPEKQALLTAELQEQKKAVESIEDPERRTHALRLLQKQEKRLLLGLPGLQDRPVSYNPAPTTLFSSVFEEIWRTLIALFSGALNPKWISGPIGIVQVVQSTSMTSIKEAIYWLGAISLNLGVLNLLPIPVLDGGTILMSLIEMVTKKRMHPKTLEKVLIPFGILLIGFFIFLTYNDLARLFHNIMH